MAERSLKHPVPSIQILHQRLFRWDAGLPLGFASATPDRGVETTVDVGYLAGYARSEITQQKRRGVADILGCDVAAQRGVLFDKPQKPGETADTGRGERLDRSRGNAVHAYPARTQVLRQIAHARFQARFGQSHDV